MTVSEIEQAMAEGKQVRLTPAGEAYIVDDPLAQAEAPHLLHLRLICESIGYGRVHQLSGQWMDDLHPGWLEAADEVAAERVAARQPEPQELPVQSSTHDCEAECQT